LPGGNAQANDLDGRSGNDILIGLDGNDDLTGGFGYERAATTGSTAEGEPTCWSAAPAPTPSPGRRPPTPARASPTPT
jgi:hypothetical protein